MSSQVPADARFIHSSPAMTQLVEEVHKIRSSDVTVLVTGESGTGKELVARAIHAISSRRAKVFVLSTTLYQRNCQKVICLVTGVELLPGRSPIPRA
jgi:transcriptional regulator with GAF, ATPase, and Fis domain